MVVRSRVRLTRAQAKEQTRVELLAAAATVFARRGYDGATVQEIAEECGRTTGALYAHFAGKEDLFLMLLDQRAEARQLDFEAMEPNQSKAGLAQWFSSLPDDDVGLLAIEFWLHAARDPKIRAKKRRQSRRDRQRLADMLATRYHAMNLEPPRPVAELATLCMSVGEGLSLLRRIDPNAVTGDMFADAVIQILRPRTT